MVYPTIHNKMKWLENFKNAVMKISVVSVRRYSHQRL